jgi:hypothetical protein
MRLEYYEGFSRYFSGDGHEFAPISLRRPDPGEAPDADRRQVGPVKDEASMPAADEARPAS